MTVKDHNHRKSAVAKTQERKLLVFSFSTAHNELRATLLKETLKDVKYRPTLNIQQQTSSFQSIKELYNLKYELHS